MFSDKKRSLSEVFILTQKDDAIRKSVVQEYVILEREKRRVLGKIRKTKEKLKELGIDTDGLGEE